MNEPRRILLLALLPIGDSLFTTPTIRAICHRYPRAKITVLTHSSTAPLMRSVPGVDDVRILPTDKDWRGSGYLFRFLRRLRTLRFDVSVDFTSPAYKWISMAAGIPERTYMKFDPLWWLIPQPHETWRHTHATEHYYNCASELDLPPWDQVDHQLSLSLSSSAQAQARRFLRSRGVVDENRPIVAIHAGAHGLGELKRWPADRYSAVARYLQQQWNAHIVLLGGDEDRDIALSIADSLDQRAIVAAGEFSLLVSLALLDHVWLFLGNDSGLLHAAAALGTPYVGIYGPTAPANFAPVPKYHDQGVIVTPPVPCARPRYFVGGDPIWSHACCDDTCQALLAITPAMVINQAEGLLRKHAITLQPR